MRSRWLTEGLGDRVEGPAGVVEDDVLFFSLHPPSLSFSPLRLGVRVGGGVVCETAMRGQVAWTEEQRVLCGGTHVSATWIALDTWPGR
jgi:hypothetical protein